MEEYKIDKGIFTFLAKRSMNVHQMRSILNSYASSKGIKRPKENRLKWYAKISELAQMNFTEFKKLYNQMKKPSSKKSYDDWYEECSMDGSFAYNGVADDF